MKKLASVLAALCVLMLGGCASGGGPDDDGDTPDPVSINIVEASAIVEAGQTFQFHYTVSNSSNTACTWSVNDVAGGSTTVGTISAAGLYTAPAPFTNSPANPTVAAGATQAFTTTADVTWSLEGASGNTAPLGSIGADG